MPVDDNSRTCVSQRRVFLELGAHFGDGWTRTHNFQSFPNLVHLRRIVSDFFQNALVVDACAFGAAADERAYGIHQHMIRRHHRRGRFGDNDMFQSFTKNLLHSVRKKL